MSIFHLKDYKDVLRRKIKEHEGQRGVLAKLAEAAGCQRSYLSQVLNTHIHLIPDHALGICEFFHFNEDETRFFLGLVDHARAGTPRLRKRISQQLHEIRERNTVLEKKIDAKVIQSTEENFLYYSSWIYAAVHVAVSIHELQTPHQIAQHLQLARETVENVLVFLESQQLVAKHSGKWNYVTGERHLSRQSALVALHHNNWRQRAVLSAQSSPNGNYHYTGVSSLSRHDFHAVSAILLEVTEKIRKLTRVSTEEELVCLNMDFFKV